MIYLIWGEITLEPPNVPQLPFSRVAMGMLNLWLYYLHALPVKESPSLPSGRVYVCVGWVNQQIRSPMRFYFS